MIPQFSQAALCTNQGHLMQNINYCLDTRSNTAICSPQFTMMARAPKKIDVLETTFFIFAILQIPKQQSFL